HSRVGNLSLPCVGRMVHKALTSIAGRRPAVLSRNCCRMISLGGSMRLNRRKFIKSLALAGASAAVPAALAQEGESIWDMMARNRVLRDADQGGNTEAARALIATNEPILSF